MGYFSQSINNTHSGFFVSQIRKMSTEIRKESFQPKEMIFTLTPEEIQERTDELMKYSLSVYDDIVKSNDRSCESVVERIAVKMKNKKEKKEEKNLIKIFFFLFLIGFGKRNFH